MSIRRLIIRLPTPKRSLSLSRLLDLMLDVQWEPLPRTTCMLLNSSPPVICESLSSPHLVRTLIFSSWIHTRDIEYLSPKAISEFLAANHRRTGGDLKRGYEIAQDPTEWDVEQQDVRKAQEDAANQVDELEDDDEEADVSTSKRKKATKEKSKKKAKVSKVSLTFQYPRDKQRRMLGALYSGDCQQRYMGIAGGTVEIDNHALFDIRLIVPTQRSNVSDYR